MTTLGETPSNTDVTELAPNVSKVLTTGTSTIAANTCRSIAGRYRISAGAHLKIESGGSLRIG